VKVKEALFACVLVLGLAVPGVAGAATVDARLIVTFDDDARRAERAATHAAADAQVEDRIRALDVDVVEVEARDEAAALARYDRDPSVASVEPDVVMRALDDCRNDPCRIPNDPRLTRQWGLQSDSRTDHRSAVFVLDADVDAPLAWSTTTGSSATTVAILDTGIDLDHRDLASRLRASVDLTGGRNPDDLHGHGTHVAGIAAAAGDNAEGVAGVAYNASLLNVKVLTDTGAGSCSITAEGIVWAADRGADVINLSLGGPAKCQAQESAIRYALDRGALVVAAAGNAGSDRAVYPGGYPNVLAVAASDRSDLRAPFSNHGSWVDIAAPGVGILSTLPNHDSRSGVREYGYLSGTSMAAPMVSGGAALIWSTVSDANGDGRTADDVRRRLEDFAESVGGSGAEWGAGRLNLCNAAAARLACPPR
jgi:thermitase